MRHKSLVLFIALSSANGFRVQAPPPLRRFANAPLGLCMNVPDKTYGTAPMKDVIDVEGAMSAFFGSKEDWSPLFRSMAVDASVPAMEFLGGEEADTTWDATPFRELPAIPTDEADRGVLASFLDAMQQALLDIPVNEAVQEDDGDLQFLEEGRRLLVVGRFQVLRGISGGTIECFDSLFSTCWSELAELSRSNEPNTGSLIVLPDYDLTDLRRFTDMNLRLPLEWLGLDGVFEVASLERGSPAIRLIHKLNDMPDEPWTEPGTEELPPNLQ
jgi:hypothetical protein